MPISYAVGLWALLPLTNSSPAHIRAQKIEISNGAFTCPSVRKLTVLWRHASDMEHR